MTSKALSSSCNSCECATCLTDVNIPAIHVDERARVKIAASTIRTMS